MTRAWVARGGGGLALVWACPSETCIVSWWPSASCVGQRTSGRVRFESEQSCIALGSTDVSAVAARSQLGKREARLWCSHSSRRGVLCFDYTPPRLKHRVLLGFSGLEVARDRQARL